MKSPEGNTDHQFVNRRCDIETGRNENCADSGGAWHDED